eukprot:1139267-Pelagomonas_calceolata.AAC.2
MEVLDGFPALANYRKRIASLPEERTEGKMLLSHFRQPNGPLRVTVTLDVLALLGVLVLIRAALFMLQEGYIAVPAYMGSSAFGRKDRTGQDYLGVPVNEGSLPEAKKVP